LDQNPLGSAAGIGINGLALDREEPAKLMGFGAVQSNPMCPDRATGGYDDHEPYKSL
jgi:argininosuccinate lyase